MGVRLFGWCSNHKRRVEGFTRGNCSSVFCGECKGYVKLLKRKIVL